MSGATQFSRGAVMDALDVIIGSSWCTCGRFGNWWFSEVVVLKMEAQLMQELFLFHSAQLEEKPKRKRMHIDDSLKNQ
jgi:hypothetical protein